METNEKEYGTKDGEQCKRIDGMGDICQGFLTKPLGTPEYHCTCHIAPPCDYCMDPAVQCGVCGWETGMPDVSDVGGWTPETEAAALDALRNSPLAKPLPEGAANDSYPTEADINYNEMWCAQNNVEFNREKYVEEYKAYHANKAQEAKPIAANNDPELEWKDCPQAAPAINVGSITRAGLTRGSFKSEESLALLAAHDLINFKGRIEDFLDDYNKLVYGLANNHKGYSKDHVPKACRDHATKNASILMPNPNVKWLMDLLTAEGYGYYFNNGQGFRLKTYREPFAGRLLGFVDILLFAFHVEDRPEVVMVFAVEDQSE